MKNALALVLALAACAPAPSSLQPEYGPVVQTSAQRPVLVASADVGAAVRSWYSQSLLQQPIIPGGLPGVAAVAGVVLANGFGTSGKNSSGPGNGCVGATSSDNICFTPNSIQYNGPGGNNFTGALVVSGSVQSSGAFTSTNSNSTSLVLGGTNNVTQNAKLVWSGVAPTVSSGFGVSPTIVGNNGTLAFQVNVGTGGAATSGVIGLPTAATGWICSCVDITTTSTTVFVTKQTASGTTSCTVGNFNDVASAAAWVASDKLNCSATAY